MHQMKMFITNFIGGGGGREQRELAENFVIKQDTLEKTLSLSFSPSFPLSKERHASYGVCLQKLFLEFART